ncbi:MAG: peptidylprolyl isomerase [Flavobacteriales bacterium]
MRKIRFILPLMVISLFCGLNGSAQNKDATVLTIENEAVSVEEFENIFRKNNRDSIITPAALDEYMELFINFKLKVKAARELGMDTVAKFRNELAGYRAQLARPYLTDGDKLDELVAEAYKNMQKDIKARHILIKCEANATPEDTLRAYTKAMSLYTRIAAGEDFETVARENSDDPSAKQNGGNLGYFTAFQMVYPFEEAAYGAKIGEVARPVRTRYGYHIIEVEDSRPARGEIRVAHIMVKEKKEEGGAKNAEDKINEIYQRLLNGESFEELSAKYSEDGSSAKKGGELPFFGPNKMVPEFEEASFALKNDNELSKPFKTSYGWHIVKRLELKPVPEFDQVEREIRSKVSKDSRAEKTRNSFIAKLKKEYNFSVNKESFRALTAKADTSIYSGNWSVKKKVLKMPLMTIDGKSYTNGDFHKYIISKKGVKSRGDVQEYLAKELDVYGNDLLVRYEDSRLEAKHSPFRLLVNEYREGILLFELTDQKVWSKAVKDSVGLEAYYEKNKEKFLWPDRIEASIYTCANAQVADQVRKLMTLGLEQADIAAEINKVTQLNLQVEEGLFTKDDKEVLSRIVWKKGLSENVELGGQVYIVDIRELIPASPKRLQDARGLVTSDYQDYLEKEWIKELRKKYKYSVNKDVLHTIH